MNVRPLWLLCLLALSACKSGVIEAEQRDIEMQADAEPASATPESISNQVRRTGPSYVTLNVSKLAGGNTSGEGASRNRRSLTSGSGFVVDDSGFIMTAAHVAVANGNLVQARAADGKQYSGEVVKVFRENDMALIKLRSFAGHAVIPAARTCMAPGTGVFSLGKPYSRQDVARVGEVEAMRFGRPVQYGAFGYPDAMVLRMNTQKGESGGPLFNTSGELQGMIVSTLADGNGQPLTLAHAIPVSSLAEFVCGSISCSARWKAAARQSIDDCGSS